MRKRLLLPILVIVCTLALFTGCGSSPEGKWHCVKITLDGEKFSNSDCKERNGYSLSVYSEVEFGKDGEGTLIVRERGEKEFEFEYEKDEDEYSIDFTKNDRFKKGTAKVEDGKLVLTIKTSESKMVMTFEKGENEEEYDLYGGKQGLKTMNTNAKLVYVTVNGACSDLVADGKISQIKEGKVGPIKISELDESDPLQKAVKTAMKDNNSEDGYVCWEIKNKYRIKWAQWSNKQSGTIGQYPNPESDIEEKHDMGEKF